jgi:hypothetical protein
MLYDGCRGVARDIIKMEGYIHLTPWLKLFYFWKFPCPKVKTLHNYIYEIVKKYLQQQFEWNTTTIVVLNPKP